MKNIFLLLLSVSTALVLNAQSLSFSEVFTDHAILQRGVEYPVWGWTKPKAKVSLTFGQQSYSTKADANGRWEISLPPQQAGGPHEISVSNKKESLKLSDVYFGDVYLLSGQSNMEWKLRQSDPDGNRAAEIADAMIREITINKSTAYAPDDHLDIAASWRPGTAENVANFSAVGSYFAHYLREEIDIPIGLVHSSWGGSRIEPWMPKSMLDLDESLLDIDENSIAAAALKTYRKEFGQQDPPQEDRGESLGYRSSNVEVSSWPTTTLPGLWEGSGYPSINGHFYYARYFELNEAQAAQGATLSLGAIDDSDWTYINGQEVGSMYAAYADARNYEIAADVLKPGKNLIIVRVEDTGGGGGFHSSPEKMYLQTDNSKIELAGTWHYQIGSWSVDQQFNHIPTLLYNKMIHPLAGLPLSGVLWYQGESNAAPNDAAVYTDHFKSMITYWRSHFNNENLPFYWVQLANFQAAQSTPDEEGWGIIRNSQTATLELPNTGQAVITDIGEADDIHPRNKWEVGRRLSLLARQNIYGEDQLVARSPVVTKAAGAGLSGIRLMVDNDGKELVVKGDRYGYPKGFVVKDKHGKWHWAQAKIVPGGNTILITPPAGVVPVMVRYAHANNPTDANIYNEAGLPLTPFSLKVE